MLALPAFSQVNKSSSGTVSNLQLDAIDLAVTALQSGRPTLTSTPTFKNTPNFNGGIAFGDSSVQTTAYFSQISSSTQKDFAFSSAQSSFSVCGATLTVTTKGNPVAIWFSGQVGSSVNAKNCLVSVLQDGAYIAPWTSQKGMGTSMQSTSTGVGNASTVSFYLKTPTAPSAASHSFCLSVAQDGGGQTCSVGGSSTSVAQFGVAEIH
jgi:hypothetical protein